MKKNNRRNKNQKLKENYSKIHEHKSHGKTLKSPLNSIPATKPRSWFDECIPNILWACILTAHLERNTYLKLFRDVLINVRTHLSEDEYKKGFITHNYLSLFSPDQFDLIFENVFLNTHAKKLLSSLLLIDCLPDQLHWERHLEKPTEEHYEILAKAVHVCFHHQSQESTDVRWLKVMYLIICGRMHFPESFADMLEEFRLYPDKGDMRKVRPSIRAMELSVRPWEFGEEMGASPRSQEELPPKHQEIFWQELFHKTSCMPFEKFTPPTRPSINQRDNIWGIYEAVALHFSKTLKNTDINPRHDASFGLTLYALSLCFGISLGYNHTFAEGRIVLRTIMETFVTLHYLKHKDEEGLWKKFRTDGIGKTKLAFLKNISSEELPHFIDTEHLEALANEDMWMELQDIDIGSWSKSDLRSMATESGVKDVYDNYYDWASGFAHAQWVCTRDTVFTVCANPLHRFHRIPTLPRFNMHSILPDAVKLINRMLDDLSNLYPAFKPRLKKVEFDAEALAENNSKK